MGGARQFGNHQSPCWALLPPDIAQCACVSQQGATEMELFALKQLTATRSSVSENLVSFERYKRWQL